MSAIPPRPRVLSLKEKKAAILDHMEKDKFHGLDDEGEPDDVAEQIAKHARPGIDGYELAQDLERRECWSPDAQLVEALDGIGQVLRAALEKAAKDWAVFWKVEPPFPDGTRVTYRNGMPGTIVKAVEGARYYVLSDEDAAKNREAWQVLDFEDVKAEVKHEPAQ